MTKKIPKRSIQQQIKHATSALDCISDYPQSEARQLLSIAVNKPTSWLIAWPEFELSIPQNELYCSFIKRRSEGEPLAYIIGSKEFWSLKLKVTPDTLIPRADTEILVEYAVKYITESDATRVLDLGTGSGAIALAIGSEKPKIDILATDYSLAALEVARANKANCKIDNVEFLQSDWFSNISHYEFELIVCNPPYVSTEKKYVDDVELKFEPDDALFSGSTGLDDIEHIITTSRKHLKNGAILALEHGYNQAIQVRNLFSENQFIDINTIQDYAHHDRVSYARFI